MIMRPPEAARSSPRPSTSGSIRFSCSAISKRPRPASGLAALDPLRSSPPPASV